MKVNFSDMEAKAHSLPLDVDEEKVRDWVHGMIMLEGVGGDMAADSLERELDRVYEEMNSNEQRCADLTYMKYALARKNKLTSQTKG